MCFLFVDRIVATIPGKLIRGVKHVTKDDDYLCYDTVGQIAFAPSLIGETLGQLAAWNVMAFHDFSLRPVAGIVASACLLRGVHPGETLLLESVIDELDDAVVRYHSIAKVGNEPVFIVDGAIGPLLPMTNFIDVDVVRRQFNEINRPGDWDVVVANASTPCSEKTRFFKNSYGYSPSTSRGLTSGSSNSLDSLPDPKVRPQDVNFRVLQFDHIVEVEPGVHWTAEKLVSRTAAYFPDHFPNNPVLPMTVLLECKLNLAHQFVSKLIKELGSRGNYQVCELRKIKMNEFIHPGDVVVCHLKLKQLNDEELVLSCQSLVDGKRVCVVEIVGAIYNSSEL